MAHDPLTLPAVTLRDMALRWLVDNDDVTWLMHKIGNPPPISSGSVLVMDLFYACDRAAFKVALIDMAITMHNENRQN